ncbi:MAG: hypothetical protein WBP93_18630, partial [Pyrinomonadaceae bacterium]
MSTTQTPQRYARYNPPTAQRQARWYPNGQKTVYTVGGVPATEYTGQEEEPVYKGAKGPRSPETIVHERLPLYADPQSPVQEQGQSVPGIGQPLAPYVDNRDDSLLSNEERQNLIWGKITPEERAQRKMEADQGTAELNAAREALGSTNATSIDPALYKSLPGVPEYKGAKGPQALDTGSDRLKKIVDQIIETQSRPTVDNNGRWHSFGAQMLRGGARGGHTDS